MREAGEDLVNLIREDPIVRVTSHIIFVGRVLGLLSGLGRTLDAKVDMVKTTLPFVMQAAQSANASSEPPDDDFASSDTRPAPRREQDPDAETNPEAEAESSATNPTC